MSKLVALILFLHPCHCPMKNSNRVEFIQKDAQEPEDKFDPEWLKGAIEHEFCRRLEPDVAITSDNGDAGPTAESDEAVPESADVDLAASPDSEVAADTAAGGDAPDGEQAAEPVAPVAKPAVAPKKVVKAA